MPSLIDELGRVFYASRNAVLCLLSHGQLTIDGFLITAQCDRRWTADQLRGREAVIHYHRSPQKRRAQLYQ